MPPGSPFAPTTPHKPSPVRPVHKHPSMITPEFMELFRESWGRLNKCRGDPEELAERPAVECMIDEPDHSAGNGWWPSGPASENSYPFPQNKKAPPTGRAFPQL